MENTMFFETLFTSVLNRLTYIGCCRTNNNHLCFYKWSNITSLLNFGSNSMLLMPNEWELINNYMKLFFHKQNWIFIEKQVFFCWKKSEIYLKYTAYLRFCELYILLIKNNHWKKRAVKEIKSEATNSAYCACYNHALNLTISVCYTVVSIRNSIGAIKETISFLTASAKRRKN
jgi:hypothetical protein